VTRCACRGQGRQAVLREFAAGRIRALVVSDVAARGLDLPGCDAVINLELPSDAAHYAHRAGRTGRAGRCAPAAPRPPAHSRRKYRRTWPSGDACAVVERAMGLIIIGAHLGPGRLRGSSGLGGGSKGVLRAPSWRRRAKGDKKCSRLCMHLR